jgi:hypothetical protein
MSGSQKIARADKTPESGVVDDAPAHLPLQDSLAPLH